MEKLTLVQLGHRLSLSYTVFFFATNGQKTKVKGKRNKSTLKQ